MNAVRIVRLRFCNAELDPEDNPAASAWFLAVLGAAGDKQKAQQVAVRSVAVQVNVRTLERATVAAVGYQRS
jgi:hypothetical protein